MYWSVPQIKYDRGYLLKESQWWLKRKEYSLYMLLQQQVGEKEYSQLLLFVKKYIYAILFRVCRKDVCMF